MTEAFEADYIVVGAGAAGCVLASRLTEDPNCKVLLLEAGGSDQNPAIHAPSKWADVWATADNWAYETVPQRHCDGRSFVLHQGKVLGGSTSLNGMVYTRGARSDFDAWAYAGNPGWDYQSVLPYFKKSEHFEDGASAYHGTLGPIHVAINREPNPVTVAAIEAAKEVGYPESQDFAVQAEGIGLCHLLIKNGKRQSMAAAFLRPAMERPNLKVLVQAPLRRLLFEQTRCVGVEFEHEGVICTARAQREVLLCAGAIGSPRLLMLSGIGAAEEMRALGIPVLADLPGVGQNLQDHLYAQVVYEATQATPPARANALECQMFWKSDPRLPVPDLLLMVQHAPIFYDGKLTGPENGISLNAGFVRTASQGSVRLKSSDPCAPPLIDPNYLAMDADMKAMLACIRICREIGMARAFDDWRGREALPGPEVQSEEDLRAYVRRAAGSGHHFAGTCKMGVDALSVVDSELRVHGTSGLRVIDASVMPQIVSAGTNATTIMIAERAVDLLHQP